MEIVAFVVEERQSKKGFTYNVLLGVTKNGDKYFLSFIRKDKDKD